MKFKYLYIVFFLLCVSNLKAQYANKDIKAYSQLYKIKNTTRAISTDFSSKLVLPPLSITKSISQTDATKNGLKTLEFAKKRIVDINPLTCGEILRADKDRYLWQMTIVSKGAKSVGLHFSKFELPVGASLFVRGRDGIKGAYTYVNNDKEFQISPITGDSIVIEYNFPEDCRDINRENIPICVNEIYHDYLGVFSFFRNSNPGEPFFNYKNIALDELVCAPNIINYPELDNQSRGVVLMLIGGTHIGTGSLINNKRNDGTPYILTASHVVNDNFQNEDDVDKVKTNCNNIVVFFNFLSLIGDKNIRGTEEQSLFGAQLVAYNKDADMTLLKITGLVENSNGEKTIPKEYRPYFNGWNIEATPKSPYFGIHHPMGTTKRYSQVKDSTLNVYDYTVSAGFIFKSFEKKHWHVGEWEIGTTAAGSSGSPLFDSRGLIIGALTGGSSDCQSPYNDYYYAIKETWLGNTKASDDVKSGLSQLLDPDNTGDLQCQGLDGKDSDKVKLLTSISGRRDAEGLQILKIDPDYNNVGSLFRLKNKDKILGAFVSFVGTTQISDNFPTINISLSSIIDNKKGVELLKKQIEQPKYRAYNRETNEAEYRDRWLEGDTCQIFIPFTPTSINSDGHYLLQIESNQGLNKLNLLGLNTLIQKNKILKNNSFIVGTDNILNPFCNGNLSVWLDLLIERQGDNNKSENNIYYDNGIDSNKLSYYTNGRIYINENVVGSSKFDWEVTIWDVLGSKILHKKLNNYQQYFYLKDDVINGVYLVKVSVNSKNVYYKIKI